MRNKNLLNRLQRHMSMRICCAYRTVSNEAVMVVAGTIPLHLLARERRERFYASMAHEESPGEHRTNTLELWQSEWAGSTKGMWTRELIPDVRPWIGRRWGEVTYHVTQCLTGHGSFMTYLQRIGKRPSPICMYCIADDDARHTLFSCPRWSRERHIIEMKLELQLNANNLVPTMLRSKKDWAAISEYMTTIISTKERVGRTPQSDTGSGEVR